MINQYTTTTGKVVTEWPTEKLWIVNSGKHEYKFLNLISFMRFMTK